VATNIGTQRFTRYDESRNDPAAPREAAVSVVC
jgi:hypothetical protein